MRPRADQTAGRKAPVTKGFTDVWVSLSAAHRHLGVHGLPRGVELDHAQDILADLMGTIVSALRPSFRLAKLEGDAQFTFAITEKVDGSLLLDTIERCYFRFRQRRRDVRQATSCDCNACVRIPDLNLKFVFTTANATSARRRPGGAARTRRHPRPSPAQERCDRIDGDRGVRAVQSAVRRRDGYRRLRAWHARIQRDVRAHRRRTCVGTTSIDAGRRRRRASASSSTSGTRSTGSTRRLRPRHRSPGSS